MAEGGKLVWIRKVHMEEIKKLQQWVLWEYQTTPTGKKTKIPINPHNLKKADSRDPSTWSSYEEVKRISKEKDNYGIGFVFYPAMSNVMGVDIDHVDTPAKKAMAEEIISKFNSYTEKSPSGTGYHILVKAKKSTSKSKNTKLDLEYYCEKRFFTVTEDVVSKSTKITQNQMAMDWFEDKYFGDKKPEIEPKHHSPITSPLSLSSREVLQIAFKAANGGEVEKLYNGDISKYNNIYKQIHPYTAKWMG